MENGTKVNLGDIREALGHAFDWDYVEQEGEDSLRFDFNGGSSSFWVHKGGTVSGEKPSRSKWIVKTLIEYGVHGFDWE